MVRVGLTGNIAVGKSFVAARFTELGAAVIDADRVSRELMEPGAPLYTRVAEVFGLEILNKDGTIDRRRLGSIVFASEEKRHLLAGIAHPAIHEAIARKIAEKEKTSNLVVVDAALLIETGGYREYDRLIVVACPPALQLIRLMSRDGLAENEAKARIAAQMPTDEKIRLADYVIDTSGAPERTLEQTDVIHQKLFKLQHSSSSGT